MLLFAVQLIKIESDKDEPHLYMYIFFPLHSNGLRFRSCDRKII